MSLIGSSRRVRVEIRETESGYSLFRDGEAFYVKGAAGYQHVKELAEAGGNSIRTWGMDQTAHALPDIRKYGLSLCAGLWLTPPRQGFDYADATACEQQFEEIRQQVVSLKDEPSLLIWGVGNELELGVDDVSANVWKSVERVAAFIKEIDPHRPVMTVLASVDELALRCIEAHCPSVDFVSFNSYGDLELVQSKLEGIGWNRPYLITEWGANGHWEVQQTAWGAEIEPTSTEKAKQVRRRYLSLNGSHGQCLGSYVFLWGSKQERTPTWYGLFDDEGRATESVDAISALWTSSSEEGACPQISNFLLAGHESSEDVTVKAGVWVEAAYKLLRGEFWPESATWSVFQESDDKRTGGDQEALSVPVETRFEGLGAGRVCFSTPLEPGCYRLFVEIRGPGRWVATANLPFLVE